ncbi:MAG: hypothetical protein ABI175_22390 [Polyangiales bacterium]
MTNALYEDEWVTVTIDASIGLVRYTRSELRYGNERDIERSYGEVGKAMARVPPGMRLLLDIRRAPPRNDAVFEAKANGALEQLPKRFTRFATLVRTAVGKLQSVRLATERGATPHVFDDEQQALSYLLG